jgi:hypothetical protein
MDSALFLCLIGGVVSFVATFAFRVPVVAMMILGLVAAAVLWIVFGFLIESRLEVSPVALYGVVALLLLASSWAGAWAGWLSRRALTPPASD